MDNKTTTAYAASLIVSAVGATIFGITGHNSKASDQYVHIYDSPTLPAEGAVPKITVLVPASTSFSLDFGYRGRSFGSGIVVCNSSTAQTKTIGSADCWFDVQYS